MQLQDIIIPRAILQDGYYYAGRCRNAIIARWSGPDQLFYHWREKFGREFIESIEYWELAGRWDQFIPIFCLGPKLPAEVPFPIDRASL